MELILPGRKPGNRKHGLSFSDEEGSGRKRSRFRLRLRLRPRARGNPAGAIPELPLGFSIKQAVHSEVLQEGNELRGVDGVSPHSVEVGTAGAIGTSETGDFPVGYFLQRIGQFTFQGIACPDRQGKVNLRIGTEMVDVPEELFPRSLMPIQSLSQILLS